MKEVRKAIVTVSLITLSAYMVSGRIYQGQQPAKKSDSKQTTKQKDGVLGVEEALLGLSTSMESGIFQGPPSATKQNSKQTTTQKDGVVELESNLLTIDVIATDANGNFVRDLKKEDFQLFEDNTTEKIEFFDKGFHAEERPLAAVFALDRSGSSH